MLSHVMTVIGYGRTASTLLHADTVGGVDYEIRYHTCWFHAAERRNIVNNSTLLGADATGRLPGHVRVIASQAIRRHGQSYIYGLVRDVVTGISVRCCWRRYGQWLARMRRYHERRPVTCRQVSDVIHITLVMALLVSRDVNTTP